MSRKGRGAEEDLARRCQWIDETLAKAPMGLHILRDPATVLDTALPLEVATLLRFFNGGELFHESIVVYPGNDMARENSGLCVGSYRGEEVFVGAGAKVWSYDSECDELVVEGTRFDRWLAGCVAAEGELLDDEGEYREDMFNEDGEMSAEAIVSCEKARLKRDPKALAPRWRLGRAFREMGESERARQVFEEVAEAGFRWAWLDLSRISEARGEFAGASEEAEMLAHDGADAAVSAYAFLQAARLAEIAGDATRVAQLVIRARESDPGLVRRHLEAASSSAEAGEMDQARELLLLAKLLEPTNLQVLDALRRLES